MPPPNGKSPRGRRSRRGTSFRRRLLAAFLLVGIIPTAIITIFTLHYFTGLTALWQNPTLSTLLENFVSLARQSLAPIQLDSAALTRRMVEDPNLVKAVKTGDVVLAEAALRQQLADDSGGGAGSVPFALVRMDSTKTGAAWHPVGPALHVDAKSRLPPLGTPAIDTRDGVVWCRLSLPPESGAAGEVIGGYRLGSDVAARARTLDEAIPRFRSLGAYQRLRIRTLWAVTGTLFLGLVLSSWIAARLLASSLAQPVTELEEATRHVASGDYSYRVHARRPDELGRLFDAFNSMTSDLQDRTEKLRRAERVAAWRDVARGLAHQIKNPLTPIRISAHRLRSLPHPEGSRERELLDECLGTLGHEVTNLERIADEFARFARLPEPKPRSIDVADLAREVAGLYVGGHPGIRLDLQVLPGVATQMLDPDLTRQVLSNLVKNAVEAMPGGGELTVRVEPLHGAGVRIRVADTGSGIAPEVRERLFTPYITTKTGGTGLGLALSHRMVADQGGTLEVLTGSGPGTTFQIDFPGGREDRSKS